jgi:hypothetical protein
VGKTVSIECSYCLKVIETSNLPVIQQFLKNHSAHKKVKKGWECNSREKKMKKKAKKGKKGC